MLSPSSARFEIYFLTLLVNLKLILHSSCVICLKFMRPPVYVLIEFWNMKLFLWILGWAVNLPFRYIMCFIWLYVFQTNDLFVIYTFNPNHRLFAMLSGIPFCCWYPFWTDSPLVLYNKSHGGVSSSSLKTANWQEYFGELWEPFGSVYNQIHFLMFIFVDFSSEWRQPKMTVQEGYEKHLVLCLLHASLACSPG